MADKILVIEDDEGIAGTLFRGLTFEGYKVVTAADGPGGLAIVRDDPPDVVILDWMLPGLDGLEVCKRLRAVGTTPILMLTAKDAVADRVHGLDAGADDYLVKPFSPRELAARVRALLRRPRVGIGADNAWRAGELVVDPRRRSVTLSGNPVPLTTIEFDLITTLIREPGVVHTRQQLLDRVWGTDYVGDEHVVDVHLANLRRKLGENAARPRWVETVRGVGYRFKEAG